MVWERDEKCPGMSGLVLIWLRGGKVVRGEAGLIGRSQAGPPRWYSRMVLLQTVGRGGGALRVAYHSAHASPASGQELWQEHRVREGRGG